jgi:RNA polymerase sigma factor (sigma-70 family)
MKGALMRDDPTVVALVRRVRDGDQHAWDQLVERYAPLVWGICRRYELGRADTDDIGQTVWLKLIEQVRALRDPAALPGWIATTTRRECQRVLRAARQRQQAEQLVDAEPTDDDLAELEQELERAERHIALRESFRQLQPRCQELLLLLFQDEQRYREIGERLGMKVGAIGPSRQRCLEELRRAPALAQLIEAERRFGKGGGFRGHYVVER